MRSRGRVAGQTGIACGQRRTASAACEHFRMYILVLQQGCVYVPEQLF